MRPTRHHEAFDPVIVPRQRDHYHVTDHADDFADGATGVPSATSGHALARPAGTFDTQRAGDRESVFEPEPAFDPDPAPAAFDQTPPPPASFNSQQAEVISLDGMRAPAPTYQPEDLDVPAFLRKRSDVM